jgi:hypothetical protein
MKIRVAIRRDHQHRVDGLMAAIRKIKAVAKSGQIYEFDKQIIR